MNKVKAFKIRAKKELEGILKQNGLLETPLSVRQVEVLAKLRNDPSKLLKIWKQAKDGKTMGPKALKNLIAAEGVATSKHGATKPDGVEVTTGSYHGLPQEVTTPADISELNPRKLPRKLKLATALHVLKNLSSAYHIIRQEGDEAQLVMLQRILKLCADLDQDELHGAIKELGWDMKACN